MYARPMSTTTTILGIDVGGSGIKGALLNQDGDMLSEKVRVVTPEAATPPQVVAIILDIAEKIRKEGNFEKVAVGFPGVVRHGIVRTAANLQPVSWPGFPLAEVLSLKLGVPVRAANDADVQGLGSIAGKGVEMVVTLGTGFGTALFEDGRLAPHLELGHHPFRDGSTYEQLLGEPARDEDAEKWNMNARLAFHTLYALVHYDKLYVGGGNAKKLNFDLPDNASVVSNKNGIKGAAKLWEQ